MKRRRAPAPEREEVLAWLERRGSKRNREGMARYGIVAPKVFGVSVGELRAYAKRFVPSHALARALWASGWYEAKMLAAFVEEPERVTPAQMDRWCKGFDNWAICDTMCFHLFDKTPHAWRKIHEWAPEKDEFTRRAAFALLASISVHDKKAEDALLLRGLRLIERASTDDRNFVKKAVNWALRSIGKRNRALHAPALELAQKLAASENAAARWVGKDAARELDSPAVRARVQKKPGR